MIEQLHLQLARAQEEHAVTLKQLWEDWEQKEIALVQQSQTAQATAEAEAGAEAERLVRQVAAEAEEATALRLQLAEMQATEASHDVSRSPSDIDGHTSLRAEQLAAEQMAVDAAETDRLAMEHHQRDLASAVESWSKELEDARESAAAAASLATRDIAALQEKLVRSSEALLHATQTSSCAVDSEKMLQRQLDGSVQQLATVRSELAESVKRAEETSGREAEVRVQLVDARAELRMVSHGANEAEGRLARQNEAHVAEQTRLLEQLWTTKQTMEIQQLRYATQHQNSVDAAEQALAAREQAIAEIKEERSVAHSTVAQFRREMEAMTQRITVQDVALADSTKVLHAAKKSCFNDVQEALEQARLAQEHSASANQKLNDEKLLVKSLSASLQSLENHRAEAQQAQQFAEQAAEQELSARLAAEADLTSESQQAQQQREQEKGRLLQILESVRFEKEAMERGWRDKHTATVQTLKSQHEAATQAVETMARRDIAALKRQRIADATAIEKLKSDHAFELEQWTRELEAATLARRAAELAVVDALAAAAQSQDSCQTATQQSQLNHVAAAEVATSAEQAARVELQELRAKQSAAESAASRADSMLSEAAVEVAAARQAAKDADTSLQYALENSAVELFEQNQRWESRAAEALENELSCKQERDDMAQELQETIVAAAGLEEDWQQEHTKLVNELNEKLAAAYDAQVVAERHAAAAEAVHVAESLQHVVEPVDLERRFVEHERVAKMAVPTNVRAAFDRIVRADNGYITHAELITAMQTDVGLPSLLALPVHVCGHETQATSETASLYLPSETNRLILC